MATTRDLEGLRLREPRRRTFPTPDAAIRWARPLDVLRAIDPGAGVAAFDLVEIQRTSEDRAAVLACLNVLSDDRQRLAVLAYAHRASVKLVARLVRRREQDVRLWIVEGRKAVAHELRLRGFLA